MEYPKDTIATGARGKKEARVLRTRGDGFVVYGYVDVESGKEEAKYSILLRRNDGAVEHLFIVPTAGGRELVVKHEVEKRPATRGIFDPASGKSLEF